MIVKEKDTDSKKPLILLTDDLPQSLEILAAILEEEFDVSFAHDGAEALTFLKNVKPDLILLDIIMPNINGFEVCTALKSSPDTKDIPIIFMSSMTDTDEIVKGFQLGAVDYIKKPFNPLEVLVRVRTHVELKRTKDSQQKLITELQNALAEVKTLRGILPICSYCKKIRDDKGYWEQVENYIYKYSGTEFSHGICPDCMSKYYPEFMDEE